MEINFEDNELLSGAEIVNLFQSNAPNKRADCGKKAQETLIY